MRTKQKKIDDFRKSVDSVNIYSEIEELKKKSGVWKKEFKENLPIALEIGMGSGSFLFSLLTDKQWTDSYNFVGLEMKPDRMFKSAKINKTFIEGGKLKLININAKFLQDIFAPEEVSVIFINFPDPWPKDRHTKRRLLSEDFLNIYHVILNKTGKIYFKTDNEPLFREALDRLGNNKYFKIVEKIEDLYSTQSPWKNHQTEFEKKYIKQGKPIYQLILEPVRMLFSNWFDKK